MDILRIVKRYINDIYPTSRSLFRWRSSESLAAIEVLRDRVKKGDVPGIRKAIDHLMGRQVNNDPPVAALSALNREGRLFSLLEAVDTVFEDKFKVTHLQKLWGRSTRTMVGILATDALDVVGWLSYFYKEKGAWYSLSQEDKERLTDFLNVMYDFPPAFAGNSIAINNFLNNHNLARKADQTTTRIERLATFAGDNAPKAYKIYEDFTREAFSSLLRSGFIPVAECDKDHNIVRAPQDPALDSFNRWGNQARDRIDAALKQTPNEAYCWRGDSRSFADISEAGGLWCKAASEGYAKLKNMRKPWNPFNEWSIRQYMFYRGSQNDNCLYTAVSATPSVKVANNGFDFAQKDTAAFKINVCFPQLEQIPAQYHKSVQVELTDNGLRQTKQLIVDEVRLYLCRLPKGTPYVDTRELQVKCGGGGFPEIALRGIPKDRLMGHIVFIRVHLGTTDKEGFVAIPVNNQSANRFPNHNVSKQYYDAANTQTAAAWGANGVVAPSPGLPVTTAITKVGRMTVLNGTIAMYQDY